MVAHCVDSNVVNGEDDNSRICCVHENCSYSSLDQCLANITSNIMINITSDVVLSSLARASNSQLYAFFIHRIRKQTMVGVGTIVLKYRPLQN